MEAYIWTKNAFPSIAQQDTWVKEIWAAVQTRTEKRMELTDRIATMMKNYGWHARGAVVKEVRTLTDATYLLAKGTEEEIKKRVKVLTKDDTFHYRNPETLEGFAQNDIIKMALQNIWFPSKRARGVVHSSHFSPISIPTLALIFAAIEFSIQRYSTGELDSAASFDETHNKPRYEAHLKNLKEWDELLPAVTAQFRQRLYDDCRKQSGAAIVRPAMGLSEDRRARALRELQEMQQGA
ncbi:hypothetical protein C8F01DRAFT_1171191 [Mycena amicta]|nr:hypothetical protein C8F01DRAFT_1171191 [Mycena amicta]